MHAPHQLDSDKFSGLTNVLKNAFRECDHLDIEADIEGEQESMPAHDIGNSTFSPMVQPSDNDTIVSSNHFELPAQWKETLSHAAKGVTDNTHQEYIRLSEACASFLIANGLISKREQFLSSTPLPNADEMIVAWIMNSCDTIGLDGKPAVGLRATYAHAQKMRASMTHIFGRMLGIGSQPWKRTTSSDGRLHAEGNPSISEKVSTYMVSLRRRKTQAGETATSARAITPDIMARLYDCNHQKQHWAMDDELPRARQDHSDIHQWGSPLHRRVAQAIYTIAYLCLLRVDEALKIRCEDLEIEENKITLTLEFRKTHQFGDIKPFVLHAFPPEEAHLCPVRAIADWLAVSGITSGFIFRRISKASGRAWANDDAAMTSEQFLEIFRNNLLDIGIDPSPYGTHSFRRGGCQYFASCRRWKLRRICDWGGWSTEFSSLTIVKYLISWNDEPEESRDNFLNPEQQLTIRCMHCGRSCACA